MGLYYDDFEVGRVWTTPGRTIGEGDITLFAGLSGDFTPIHVDAHESAKGPFGGRIAHGPLVMSIAIGLMAQERLFDGTVVALLNLNWDFPKVVMIGDTIRARVTVIEKRPTSKPERGVVRIQIEALKQDGAVAQKGVNTVLMLTRPKG